MEMLIFWTWYWLPKTLMLAGGHEPEVRVKLVIPTFASLPPFERNIGFAAEEEAIRELYDVYATAHGDQDVDVLGDVWFKSESDDVFTGMDLLGWHF